MYDGMMVEFAVAFDKIKKNITFGKHNLSLTIIDYNIGEFEKQNQNHTHWEQESQDINSRIEGCGWMMTLNVLLTKSV